MKKGDSAEPTGASRKSDTKDPHRMSLQEGPWEAVSVPFSVFS